MENTIEVITIPKAEFFAMMRSMIAEQLKDIYVLAEILKAQNLSTGQAAKYLGVTSATVRNWTLSGKLKKNEMDGYNIQDLAELKQQRKPLGQ